MQISVTGRHVSVTDAVKSYAEDKIKHLVEKHSQARITKIHITMDVQKIQHTVEAEMHSPMENLYGRAVSKDMYVSIDQLIDKMEKQLVKLKSKHDRKKGSDSKSIRRMEGEVEE